ncbi:suppressor of fused domain protein [Actinomadura miaoliensis]|uniref:Suppressor of fused-like domain-containing protein n=1 Tax=Actinomadura miaoliensis TaxID=430685 RepID=A0ABP7UWG8_9ACTN
MTDTGAHDRYLDHLKRHLGELVETWPAGSDGEDRGFDLHEFHLADPGFTTVITDGLRTAPIKALAPLELACTLRGDQRHIARYLVGSMARMMLRNPDTFVQYGFVFENSEPFVEGTGMQAVLGAPSMFFRNGFDLIEKDSGGLELQIITLLPISAGEAAHVGNADEDALFELFWEHKAPVWDVTRASVI